MTGLSTSGLSSLSPADQPAGYAVLAYPKMEASATNGGADAYFDDYVQQVATPHCPAADFVYRNGLIESGSLLKWSGASGIVVQSSIVSSGTHAARATATGSPAFAFKTFATGNGQLNYRLRFNVQSQAATSMYLLRIRAAPNGPIMGLYIGSTGILCYRNEHALTNTCSSISPSKGVWHTALVHVVVNGSAGVVEVWFGGTELISKTDDLGTPGVGRIELGDSASGKTFDVALDDVVVDTNALTP
jgi:hypothetical protein